MEAIKFWIIFGGVVFIIVLMFLAYWEPIIFLIFDFKWRKFIKKMRNLERKILTYIFPTEITIVEARIVSVCPHKIVDPSDSNKFLFKIYCLEIENQKTLVNSDLKISKRLFKTIKANQDFFLDRIASIYFKEPIWGSKKLDHFEIA